MELDENFKDFGKESEEKGSNTIIILLLFTNIILKLCLYMHIIYI